MAGISSENPRPPPSAARNTLRKVVRNVLKRVLCFGDSNTWGYDPETCGRYGEEVRWTGVCRRLLTDGFRILEDGINGRTTVFEDPYVPYRCGRPALCYALMAQRPLDALVLYLGTNDLKYTDARGSARGAEELLRLARNANECLESYTGLIFPREPKLLLIAPTPIRPEIAKRFPSDLLSGRAEESARLAEWYRAAAEKWGAAFLDAGSAAEAGEADCVHLSAEAHRAVGEAAAASIRALFD